MTNVLSLLDLLVVNDDGSGNETTIQQISDSRIDPGIESILRQGAGGVHPKFGGNASQAPVIRFTTDELDTLLGLTGIVGAAIDDATTVYFKKALQTGPDTRANTTHTKGEINYGYIHVERITLDQNPDQSSADVVLTVGYDGTNDPVAYSGTVALPTTTIDSAKHFAVGKAEANGTQIQGIIRAVIEPNITLRTVATDGEVWPDFIGLMTTAPRITLTTHEVSELTTTGIGGKALDGSNGVVVYARKVSKNQANDVARVADGTAEHVKFTMLNGRYWCNPSASDSNAYENEMIFEGTSADDSTVPITVDTASAIT